MSNQFVVLKNSGLQTYPNQLMYSSGYVSETSAPMGSLYQADDVVINRENVVEPRRGFTFYGTAMGGSSTADICKQILAYKNRILRHWASSMDYDDGTGNFTTFSTSVNEVQTGLRIKYAESNGNLYFTTDSGIQKISIKDASGFSPSNIVSAGLPEALDITLSLNSQAGFFNQESVVGYRVVWGITDANTNVILSAPSNRQIIFNPLTPLLANDFNALLAQLDTLNQPYGIKAQDYVATYGVPASTSNSSLLRSNLISLAEALDTDIASSSVNGTQFLIAGSLNDVTGSVSGNQITLLSSSGVYVGQQVSLDTTVITAPGITGTTSTTSNQITSASGAALTNVAEGQLVTALTSGIIPANTYVTSVSGTTITISSIPLISGTFTSEFNFTNPNPFVAGTTVTAISGDVVTLSESTTFSANYVDCLNFSSVYVNEAGTTVIAANTPTASTPANDNSSTGVTYNVTTVLTHTPSILQIGDPVVASGIVPSTFDTTGIVQSITGNAVTFNISTNPGTFVSQTNATLERYKYSYLTQPLTLSTDPYTNELLSMQVYYQSILSILQNEPTLIVGSTNPFTSLSTTETATVNITFPIPAGITTANYYQVYRTQQLSGSTGISLDTLDPGDEEYLAFEANPTAQDLTNGYITVQDIEPDAYLGADLYTNANFGTGITSANVPPPLSQDMTLYYNYMFYANTTSYHSLNSTLLGVTQFTSGVSTLTISDGTTSNTYTFSTAGEDPATKTILISSASTPAQQIDQTARSIVNVINRNPNEIVYAFYESGPTDLPGKILFQARQYGQSAFSLTVDSTQTGSDFNPALPTSGTSVNNTSQNDARANRLFYSTQFQPDAVPIVNYLDIGPQDQSILRVLALRQSLFIFKQEGIYRITGNTANSFQVALFDSSTYLTSPDSAAILNNTIYCLTNQGVVNVSDSGVQILSRPIEGSLLPLHDSLYPNYSTATFGLGYESDRTYNLWTVTNPEDTLATQSFRYNTITQAWTRCTKTANSGVVNPFDDTLYVGATDTNYIEKERKNFDRTDYADRQWSFTLGANSIKGTNITLSSVANVGVGDVLVQVQNLTVSQFNRLLTKLDNDQGLKNRNYVSTLTVSPGVQLRDSLTSLANALDSDAGTQTKTYASSIASYTNSFSDIQAAFNTIVTLLNSDLGTFYKNYVQSSGTTSFEINIVAVNKSTNVVTTASTYPFIQGPITDYNTINSIVQWLPETMGDPSMSKHVSDATIMFNQLNFTTAQIAFSSDICPGFQAVEFPGVGNGAFGTSNYGNTFYGQAGNSAPLRTYVPRDMQRCRYLNMQFTHAVAREAFQLYGLSLTFNQVSQRAWR